MTAATKVKKQVATEQNAFAGQKERPTEKALAAVLGSTFPLWEKLVTDLKNESMIDVSDWHSSSEKYGWSLRLQLKKRNIVYLGARQGYFVAAFALGDRAVAAVRKTDLSPEIIQLINSSKRYAEGTAVRIEVTTPKDIEVIKMLARIKIEN